MGLDISDNDVYAAVESFLYLIVPAGMPILRGQQNRVSMPSVDCVIMTTVGVPRRIGTNVDTIEVITAPWTADSNLTVDGSLSADGSGGSAIVGFNALIQADFEYAIQVDFYSAATKPPTNPMAESYALSAELLWRDKIAWYTLPEGIKPLYSEDLRQLPIIGAEDQWIARWSITLTLDYQPVLTVPTQAATAVTVTPEPLDVYFSPNPPTWTADSNVVTADSNAPA